MLYNLIEDLINHILRSDWLPDQERFIYFAPLGLIIHHRIYLSWQRFSQRKGNGNIIYYMANWSTMKRSLNLIGSLSGPNFAIRIAKMTACELILPNCYFKTLYKTLNSLLLSRKCFMSGRHKIRGIQFN